MASRKLDRIYVDRAEIIKAGLSGEEITYKVSGKNGDVKSFSFQPEDVLIPLLNGASHVVLSNTTIKFSGKIEKSDMEVIQRVAR